MSISRVQISRLAGLLYLIVAVTGGFSELVVRTGVTVAGDAAATAENIRASAPLFRLGFVTDLIDIATFVLLGLVLYVLLSPVNRRVAATFVIFNAVAAAVMSANMINHAGALLVATDPAFTSALGAASANGLALLFMDLHHQGYLVAQLFFGGWLLPLGYVVYKSGFFPRALGILLMIGCVSYLVEMGATYLSPTFDSTGVVLLAMPAAIAEVSFTVWLLVKGARPETDSERATQISGRAATA
jgi:Domain of unknown function (DUF4386)